MNLNNLKQLIRSIVMESLNALSEGHQHGEWWIDDNGQTTYCDNQVTDQGHESVVIQALTHEILNYFGLHEDEPQELSAYEESMKEHLKSDGRLTDDEEAQWENMPRPHSKSGGPADIIIQKMLEDGEFNKDMEQAADAVYIAYGSSTRDARNYAMRYWKWKVMKTFGGSIEIQTWHLKPDDLGIIVRGIWDIMEDSDSDEDDKDPLVNLTVQAKGRRYSNIPFSVLEKKMPQKIQAYQSGANVGYTETINEDYHFHHKEYRLYEGNRHIVALFNDNTRLKFEVHFRNAHGIDKEKWRQKAMSTWKSCANELHRDVPLSDVCNPIQKSWKDCFKEAMTDPRLKPYIRAKFHKLFDDKGYPAKVQGKPQPVIDPVNFTSR